LSGKTDVIESYVAQRLAASSFNFSIKICEVDDICGLNFYKKEFYAKDRIIGSNLTYYEPKKIKIFMWID